MAERNGQTVTVACKLPHGLFLRLFDRVETPVNGPAGQQIIEKLPMARAETVTLRGYLDHYNPALPPAAQGSRFAFTDGVSKEFWDAWLDQNKQHDAVRNHLIFAHENADVARRMAKERERDTRSGFEPIMPDSLPAVMKAAAAA